MTINAEIQEKIDDNKRGGFYLLLNKKQIGELEFYIENNIIFAYHTGILPEYEGKGYAKKLFEYLIIFAKKNEYKIEASCSYITINLFRNKETLSDIINHYLT